jgi:hypothetical protein
LKNIFVGSRIEASLEMFWKEMNVDKILHERKHYLNEEVGYSHNSLHLNSSILSPRPILGSKCSWWTNLISTGEMSPEKEKENKKMWKWSDFGWFPSLEVENIYWKFPYLYVVFWEPWI